MREAPLVKPTPFKGFSKKRIIYVPIDSPTRVIHRSIEKHIQKIKQTPFGKIILLKDKILLYQCISSPLAVLSLERLIASGAEEIIVLGFCGSLIPGSRIGDAISITGAISEEGTSKHYFPSNFSFSPSPSLRNWIENMLDTQKFTYSKKVLVTTDAPFRETLSWMKEKRHQNIDCVDMETSAVFALSEYYGLRAAALMLVSDILTEDKHKTGFFSPLLHRNIKKYFLPFILEKEKDEA
ncbi:MAG: hypothetical protein MUP98_06685 [Candidatus Aminicenantes bacterium]|nr:hypothetical protein [Candidatus Aminicenantes bacterium]